MLFLLIAQLVATLGKIVFLFAFVLTVVPLLVWAERRISAWIQDRKGPNRVGPAGLLQPLADLIKFLSKESFVPERAERFLYNLAPLLMLVPALMVGAVIPWSKPIPPDSWIGYWLSAVDWAPEGIPFQVIDVDIGILYFYALASLGVYGVILAGWAANNKYTLLGGLRASASMVSYELSLGLSVVVVLLMTGTLRINGIVDWQQGAWLVFYQPLACLTFMVTVFAENNRLPFDLAESEQELVGGYHTEYGGIKFALSMLAEYAHMAINSALIASLFFGGWRWFGLEDRLPWWATLLLFIGKALFFMFFFIWVRWTFPRFRFDQVIHLGWKVLLPMTLGNAIATAVALVLVERSGWPLWPVVMAGQVVVVAGAILGSTIQTRRLQARAAAS
ncbi:MAG: NADH-quinone oxidoreductase subunit H 2 [Candidatus Poribacteria bacterium]|nr:MAG: NADH-quinone oxidoreductase subunit H 2 [Candidatus Poribacteria bacterium]